MPATRAASGRRQHRTTSANARQQAGRDTELWLAAHETCGPFGCADCCPTEVVCDDATWHRVGELAAQTGVPVDVYLLDQLYAQLESRAADAGR